MPQVPEGDPNTDERDHKTRHTEAEEAERREEIISGRVLMARRKDADGNREQPRKDKGRERECEGGSDSLPDQGRNRLMPFERLPEIAVEDNARDPLPVLHVNRPV